MYVNVVKGPYSHRGSNTLLHVDWYSDPNPPNLPDYVTVTILKV